MSELNKCCIANLELAQDKIREYLDDLMPDDYLKASENAIADIDTVIFQGLAGKKNINERPSQWVSVETALPDDCEIVLVIKKGFMNEVPWVSLYEGGQFRNIERVDEIFEPLYWMKIPPAPDASEVK